MGRDVERSRQADRNGIEMRLDDAQAQRGRWALKVRDDPVDSFVVVVADTGRNREVLDQYDTLFADLPRIGPATFLRMLKAGQHPPPALCSYQVCRWSTPGENSRDLRLDDGRTRRRPATSTLELGP